MKGPLSPRGRRGLQILAVAVVLLCLYLLLPKMSSMSADRLFYINTGSQLALVLMGVAMAVRDAWPRRHPYITLAAFALVGVVGIFAAVQQGNQSAKEATATQQEARNVQADVQKGVVDIKTLLQQPNPDRDAIISRLDKLSEKTGQPSAVILPTPSPTETAYSKLTNRELKKAVADFIPSLKGLEDRISNHYLDTLNRQEELSKQLQAAKTEDERRKIWQANSKEGQRFYFETNTEYQTKYRAQAVALRDELLRRLPPQPETSRHIYYESLSGPSPIEDLITDLQRLALLLT